MNRETVKKIVDEARNEEANLIFSDRRDTFTVEPSAEISAEDDYLRVSMEDGQATVYIEYDQIYKLVVEKEKAGRKGSRTGFGATIS